MLMREQRKKPIVKKIWLFCKLLMISNLIQIINKENEGYRSQNSLDTNSATSNSYSSDFDLRYF